MSDIHSTVTDLPLSCKSAAEHMSRELAAEDRADTAGLTGCHRQRRSGADYADLPEACLKELTKLEQSIEKQTGDRVALVAYRV